MAGTLASRFLASELRVPWPGPIMTGSLGPRPSGQTTGAEQARHGARDDGQTIVPESTMYISIPGVLGPWASWLF